MQLPGFREGLRSANRDLIHFISDFFLSLSSFGSLVALFQMTLVIAVPIGCYLLLDCGKTFGEQIIVTVTGSTPVRCAGADRK